LSNNAQLTFCCIILQPSKKQIPEIMRKFTSLILCFLLAISQLWAQNRTVTGKVVDDKNNPISGASVVAFGSKVGASTEADGSFKLSVPY
jgi:hypothetical protein